MTTANQPYHAERYLTPYPTSPWTEVFQQAAAPVDHSAESHANPSAASTPEHSDQPPATRDTLSALFQQFNKN